MDGAAGLIGTLAHTASSAAHTSAIPLWRVAAVGVGAPCRSLPLPAAPCQSLPLPTTPCRCRTLPASADSLNPSRGREWEGCVFEFSPRLSLSLPPSLPLSQRAPSLAPSFPHPWPHSCLFISRRFLLSQTTDWRRSNHILSRCERLVPLLSPRLVLARAEGDPVPH